MNTCRHYWDIESANGATATGVCKRCGKVRQFYTTEEGLGKRRFNDHSCKPTEFVIPPGVVSMAVYSTRGQRS